jgi:hypothetical protein
VSAADAAATSAMATILHQNDMPIIHLTAGPVARAVRGASRRGTGRPLARQGGGGGARPGLRAGAGAGPGDRGLLIRVRRAAGAWSAGQGLRRGDARGAPTRFGSEPSPSAAQPARAATPASPRFSRAGGSPRTSQRGPCCARRGRATRRACPQAPRGEAPSGRPPSERQREIAVCGMQPRHPAADPRGRARLRRRGGRRRSDRARRRVLPDRRRHQAVEGQVRLRHTGNAGASTSPERR